MTTTTTTTTTTRTTSINDGSSDDADVAGREEEAAGLRQVPCPPPPPPSTSFERVPVVGAFGEDEDGSTSEEEEDEDGGNVDEGSDYYGEVDGASTTMMMMDSVELPPPPSWFLDGGATEDPLLDALDAAGGTDGTVGPRPRFPHSWGLAGDGRHNSGGDGGGGGGPTTDPPGWERSTGRGMDGAKAELDSGDDPPKTDGASGHAGRSDSDEQRQMPWRVYLPLAARELTHSSLSRASRYARLSYVTVATSGFYSSTGGVTSDLNAAGGYSVDPSGLGGGDYGDDDDGEGGGREVGTFPETVLLEEEPDGATASGDGGCSKEEGRLPHRPRLQQQQHEKQKQKQPLPHFSSLPWLDRQLVSEWRTVSEEDARYLTEAQNELIRRRTAHRHRGGNGGSGAAANAAPSSSSAADADSTAEDSGAASAERNGTEKADDDVGGTDGTRQRHRSTSRDDRRRRLEPLDEDPSVLSSSSDDSDDLDVDLLDDESITKARSVVPPPLPRPTWDHSSNCHSCLRTFSPTLLRHHCRACGHSVCSSHSSETHRLPHFGYHPLVPERVCDACKVIFSKRDLAERVAWRLARCRDFLGGDLTPYFATGVDTIQDAALRFTHWTLHLTRRMPLGAQATVAVETVEVLRKHGLNCVFGFLLRNEFLQAAEMLARVAGVDARTWPLSVHELSAAIFYALVEHKSARGMDPEGEHRMHRLRDDDDCCHQDEKGEEGREEDVAVVDGEEVSTEKEHVAVEAKEGEEAAGDGGSGGTDQGVCVVVEGDPADESRSGTREEDRDADDGVGGEAATAKGATGGGSTTDDDGTTFDVAAERSRRTGEHAEVKLPPSSSSSSSSTAPPPPPQPSQPSQPGDGGSPTEMTGNEKEAGTTDGETVEDLLAMADDAIRRGGGAASEVEEGGDGVERGHPPSAEDQAGQNSSTTTEAPPPSRGGDRRSRGNGGGVCSHVSDSLLQSLLFYAPLALHFIYAENEIDMQLLAAQQGWSLLYAHLNQFDDTHHHHHHSHRHHGSPSSSPATASEGVGGGGGGGGGLVTDRPAYALFAHGQHKVACFAIRGTATMNDVVTDIRAIPVPFPFEEDENEETSGHGRTKTEGVYGKDDDAEVDGDGDDDEESWTAVPRPRGMALCGMARAAQNLFRENSDVLLHLARNGYRIRIVGHSLGGGVAALLGVLVRRHLVQEEELLHGGDHRLRVYGYGTPACVDSKLAKIVSSSEDDEDFVTTVVCHDDVVPRLTPTSVRGLLKHLLRVRETWVRDHLMDDVLAVAVRAGRGWAPRWRGSFMLRGGGGVGGTVGGGVGGGVRDTTVGGGNVDGSSVVGVSRCPHCGYEDSTTGVRDDGASANGSLQLGSSSDAALQRGGGAQVVNSLPIDGRAGDGDDVVFCPRCGRGTPLRAMGQVVDEESLLESSDDDDDDDKDNFFAALGMRRHGGRKPASIRPGGAREEDEASEDWVPFDEPPIGQTSHHSHDDTTGNTDSTDRTTTRKEGNAEQDDDEEARSGCGSPVVLEESPLPRMYLPGKIVHIYTHRGAYRATFVPRNFRELRRISLAGNMLGDHTTKSYYESMLEVRSVRRAGGELPRWTGFGEGVTCSCCASRFSWASTSDSEAQEARDKHNCRSCGCLVCHPCSRNRVALPQIGIEVPVRVCDRCYHDLGTGLGGTGGEDEVATMTRSYLEAGAKL